MAWARIDDAFDDHPKVLAVLEHDQGGAAIGLWTLCLTWAHRNTLRRGKTPGLLPASLPRRYLGPGARELAALLVKEGLWEALGEGDGWRVHDFDRYLPTEKTSRARSEAGRRGAASRWGRGSPDDSESDPDGNLPPSDSNGPSSGHSADSNPMAPDGEDVSIGDSAQPITPRDSGPPPGDGNELAPDGNLLFGSQPAMANDGSCARARRAISNEIASRDPRPIPVPPSAGAAPRRAARPPLSITQRSKRLTDAYAKAEPMCKWPAVNAVVIRAIKTGKWSDDEISAGLLRMAAENRSVTIDSLRTELGGLPPPRVNGTTVDRHAEAEKAKFSRAMERAAARERLTA